MQQQTTIRSSAHLKRFDVFLHIGKTFRLIGSLLTDPRISLMRKLFFLGSIGCLLVVLLFPDIFNELILSTVLPLLGTVLGIPLDAGFDWIAFALLIANLLRVFPADIVAEHYQAIFR